MTFRPQQVIFYGAPGTGKSFSVDESTAGKTVIRATIHPEYTYSDFVGQLLPDTDNDGGVRFSFVPGPLTEALKTAYLDRATEVVLVLEELSRGNVAAVFGDTFQLLDRGPDGNSRYAIFNRMIASQIVETEEWLRSPTAHEVRFPANLSILATVNINDQNVAPMDTAFKRRFDWKYVDSLPALGSDGTPDTQLNNPALVVRADSGAIDTNWLSFYTSLNQFIVDKAKGMGRNEDRQVGQFFVGFPNSTVIDSHATDLERKADAARVIEEILKNKLLQYLWQDVQGHASGFGGRSLFHARVASFGELYRLFDTAQVFNDEFLEGFLRPNSNGYQF